MIINLLSWNGNTRADANTHVEISCGDILRQRQDMASFGRISNGVRVLVSGLVLSYDSPNAPSANDDDTDETQESAHGWLSLMTETGNSIARHCTKTDIGGWDGNTFLVRYGGPTIHYGKSRVPEADRNAFVRTRAYIFNVIRALPCMRGECRISEDDHQRECQHAPAHSFFSLMAAAFSSAASRTKSETVRLAAIAASLIAARSVMLSRRCMLVSFMGLNVDRSWPFVNLGFSA